MVVSIKFSKQIVQISLTKELKPFELANSGVNKNDSKADIEELDAGGGPHPAG
jgi:hypothetical protein